MSVPSREGASRSRGPRDERAPPAAGSRKGRSLRWLTHCAALATTYLLLAALLGPTLTPSGWHLDTRNPAVAEADAWLSGGTSLPTRLHDTGLIGERVINVFPPAITLASTVMLPLDRFLMRSGAAWPAEMVYVAFALLPIGVIYFASLVWTQRIAWAIGLTVFWVAGTALAPALYFARESGGVYWLNHVWSQVGLALLFAAVHRGRVGWMGAVGFVLSVWTRQLTLFYAAPLLVLCFAKGGRSRWIGLAAVAIAIGGLAAANTVRTGLPIDFGYATIYVGVDSVQARAAREHGVWSPHFVMQNLRYLHAEPPVRWVDGQWRLAANPMGASMWLTTPLLILCVGLIGATVRSGVGVGVLLATAGVLAAQLFYHNTGSLQPGFARFTLDATPAILFLAAPALIRVRPLWVALLAAASLAYFRTLIASF